MHEGSVDFESEGAPEVADDPFTGGGDDNSLNALAEDLLSSATGKKADKDETSEPQQDEEPEAETEEVEPEGESDEDEEEAAPAPVARKIKIDDQTEITEDEAKAGYLRQSDYTRKTQATASEVAALRAERSEIQTYLGELKQSLQSLNGAEPDWAKVASETPELLAQKYAEWDIGQKNLQKVEAAQAEIRRRNAEADAKTHEEFMVNERRKLVEAIPEWKDATKMKADAADIIEYGKSLGFSDSDLEISDHRIIRLLRDAALAKKAKAKMPSIQAKIDKVKMSTPGSANITAAGSGKAKLEKAAKRVAQSGSAKDGGDWLFQLAKSQK